MQDRGFQQRRFNPAGFATIILLHGAAIAALALVKMEVPVKVFTPLPIINIPADPPVQPPPPPEVREARRAPNRFDVPSTIIPDPASDFRVEGDRREPVILDAGSTAVSDGATLIRPLLPPPPSVAPVRVEAKLLAGELQPPYPASEQRLEREGKVVVSLRIGSDGRVKAVDRISSTSDAFFAATERHARRAWRFAPATEDGRPVESTKVISISFRLEG